MMLKLGKAELRWGILSAFPKPMPVRHDAAVFPRFFTTEKSLNLPFLTRDLDVATLGENRFLLEKGSLCFRMVPGGNSSFGDCILLTNQALGWFLGRPKWGKQNMERRNTEWGPKDDSSLLEFVNLTYTQEVIWFRGTFLMPNESDSQKSPNQPKLAPHCRGTYEGEKWPWMGCQAAQTKWADKNQLFTFSPNMRGPFGQQSEMKSGLFLQDKRMIPYSKWLLCGINGGCSDLSPLVLLQGGETGLHKFLCIWNFTRKGLDGESKIIINETEACLTKSKTVVNGTTYPFTPVCVYSPFLFILTNGSFQDCTSATCWMSQCWDARQHSGAMVARIPRWVPAPVEVPSTVALFRQKRDFGVTAALVVTLSASAAAATAAGLAMQTSVLTGAALDQLSASVSEALNVQSSLQSGLMVSSQRVDLGEEQLGILLWQLAQLGCEWKMSAVCVTGVQYENFTRAANLSRMLSLHLAGNWSEEFDANLDELRRAVVALNSTRVDLSLAEGLTSWLSSAASLFKEWVGVGMFFACCLGGCVVCLWLVCRLRAQTRRDKAVISQALAALECGSSPQVWLSALKNT